MIKVRELRGRQGRLLRKMMDRIGVIAAYADAGDAENGVLLLFEREREIRPGPAWDIFFEDVPDLSGAYASGRNTEADITVTEEGEVIFPIVRDI